MDKERLKQNKTLKTILSGQTSSHGLWCYPTSVRTTAKQCFIWSKNRPIDQDCALSRYSIVSPAENWIENWSGRIRRRSKVQKH